MSLPARVGIAAVRRRSSAPPSLNRSHALQPGQKRPIGVERGGVVLLELLEPGTHLGAGLAQQLVLMPELLQLVVVASRRACFSLRLLDVLGQLRVSRGERIPAAFKI